MIDIEGMEMSKIEKIIVQRTNELSLAVRKYTILMIKNVLYTLLIIITIYNDNIEIAQALMVKHENDTDNINELKNSNNHLKEQQQEYKTLLNQTMESLEKNSVKIDSLNEDKKNLTKVNHIVILTIIKNLFKILYKII